MKPGWPTVLSKPADLLAGSQQGTQPALDGGGKIFRWRKNLPVEEKSSSIAEF
jgi:hypothetical protein